MLAEQKGNLEGAVDVGPDVGMKIIEGFGTTYNAHSSLLQYVFYVKSGHSEGSVSLDLMSGMAMNGAKTHPLGSPLSSDNS